MELESSFENDYPETLYEYTLSTFEIALKTAIELEDFEAINKLFMRIQSNEEGYKSFLKYLINI